jgi:salicylate hydroxylase
VAAPVVIVGGGVGGLAAALALAKAGIASRVLERTATPATAGAGIQLGPNAVQALRALGVAGRLLPAVAVPDGVAVRSGATGRVLARMPLGAAIAARHAAPYWTVHRQDLLAAMLETVRGVSRIEVRHGVGVARIEARAGGARVHGESGETLDARAVIGADGLWSRVRGGLTTPRFSGKIAARAVIGAGGAGPLAGNDVGAWLAPGIHVVHYPVRAGTEVNVVVIYDDDWRSQEWSEPAPRSDIAARVAGLHGDLASVLERVPAWQKWALAEPLEVTPWTQGARTLLGDAAHAMQPFLAQGGAMALEDALVLAAEAAASPDDLTGAFARYEAVRRPRVARVQAGARRNGRIYHLGGPLALVRDVAMSAMGGGRLVASYDWLYGWRPPAIS